MYLVPLSRLCLPACSPEAVGPSVASSAYPGAAPLTCSMAVHPGAKQEPGRCSETGRENGRVGTGGKEKRERHTETPDTEEETQRKSREERV